VDLVGFEERNSKGGVVTREFELPILKEECTVRIGHVNRLSDTHTHAHVHHSPGEGSVRIVRTGHGSRVSQTFCPSHTNTHHARSEINVRMSRIAHGSRVSLSVTHTDRHTQHTLRQVKVECVQREYVTVAHTHPAPSVCVVDIGHGSRLYLSLSVSMCLSLSRAFSLPHEPYAK